MADTAPAPSTNGRVFECTTLRGIRCYVRTDDPPAAEAALDELLDELHKRIAYRYRVIKVQETGQTLPG
ncbi:MAG TPA: hypothetical protein VM223_08995, partial [Planctomycetota bacterium]|nr:hypothetical protein [Planctomycetota bacterium]